MPRSRWLQANSFPTPRLILVQVFSTTERTFSRVIFCDWILLISCFFFLFNFFYCMVWKRIKNETKKILIGTLKWTWWFDLMHLLDNRNTNETDFNCVVWKYLWCARFWLQLYSSLPHLTALPELPAANQPAGMASSYHFLNIFFYCVNMIWFSCGDFFIGSTETKHELSRRWL